MYSYNYGYPNYNQYRNTNISNNPNDERFIGGIITPLLLGGVAGYAIGQNNNYNRPYMYYTPYPYYYPYYNPYYGRKF